MEDNRSPEAARTTDTRNNGSSTGTGSVSFVGAGPGDPDLITVQGARRIQEADCILFTGSLVPETLFSACTHATTITDTAALTFQEITTSMYAAVQNGQKVARVHTGDPALYGALREESTFLEERGIPYEIIPGVSAAHAAAARARISFTVPEVTQTLIITRIEGRTPMPEKESIEKLARTNASMAVYLSAKQAAALQAQLLSGGYAPTTPVFCAHRVGFPDEHCCWTPLTDLADTVARYHLEKQTVFLVLPAEEKRGCASRLYAEDFRHSCRGS